MESSACFGSDGYANTFLQVMLTVFLATMFLISEDDQTAKSRLAQLIKDLRGEVSQREFARMIGTSYTSIQDWENQVRLPSAKNLQRLAQLKGWTEIELVSYLLNATVPMQAPTVDWIDPIVAHLPSLSPEQLQYLWQYLNAQVDRPSPAQPKVKQEQG